MIHNFEAVFLNLYDVGQSVDFNRLVKILPGVKPLSYRLSRDTPDSILLPTPFILPLDHWESGAPELQDSGLSTLDLKAKIYADGVITLECRMLLKCDLGDLHTIRSRRIQLPQGALTPDALAQNRFEALRKKITKAIRREQYIFDPEAREQYRIFCQLDGVEDPAAYLEENSRYLAAFLLGEDPAQNLHTSQVETTLRNTFSFRTGDLAVFDLDRAFLVDPEKDYEDLILILEHANYQLLELRTLDRLLDKWLEEAERDIRRGGMGRFSFFRQISRKLGRLQALRIDALFILENLENSSRIIGDYYLEQVYRHLCGLLNTEGWKKNVEKRLELLHNIYSLTKSDQSERMLVILELVVVLMIGFEIATLFFPLK